MKKYFLSGLFAFSLFLLSNVQAADDAFFQQSDSFFKTFVSPTGGVDYEGIVKNREPLDVLIKGIHSFELASADVATQKAFWINAYNLLTIYNVVSHYPINSPLDVPGFFDKATFFVAGSELTLSDIENKKIRPTFKDPRFHFVLVCAGKGCPPLLNAAYLPATVETQLDERTKLAVNDANWTKVNETAATIQISEIFKWYEADFADAGGTLTFISKFRTTPIPVVYKMSFYTYDWALNKK